MIRRFITLPLTLLILIGCGTALIDGEVPFVPTPVKVVDRMLDLAEVKPGDVVYDLGSGDGRIVIRAAKRYGVRGVGIEIDSDLVRRSQINAASEGVGHLVEFRAEDALAADLSEATVVTLYMLPGFIAKLRPALERDLRKGSRIVSHDFPIEGWAPARVEEIAEGFWHRHKIYLWKIEK